MPSTSQDDTAPYLARIDFVVELAQRLHCYGASSQRLEGAVTQVARRLGLDTEIWSNPTGMILSFPDRERGAPHSITRVIRLEPGETNLGRLAATDAIAEDVMSGRRDIAAGLAAIRALDRPPGRFAKALAIFSFGLSSASVTGLFPHSGWADLVTAAVLGMMIGALTVFSENRPRWRDAHEALAAFFATFFASVVATVLPLSLQNVVIASLIVLMPGLALTTAVAELYRRGAALPLNKTIVPPTVVGNCPFAGAATASVAGPSPAP